MAAVNKRLLLQRLLLIALLRKRIQRRQQKCRKRFWVRRLFEERDEKGEFNLLVKDMRLFDHEYFFQCFRMTPTTFEKLLCWVGPYMKKQSTKMRDPISENERLSTTLRFMSSEDS